jgi:NAD(P)-dependent dehydrogenase (short-subunit alcohol dehydrogenase family)
MAQTNKIALITGGSRGLGKSAALKLAREGHHVILTYHSKKDEAQQVVNDIEALGLKAASLQLDVSKVKSFDAFKEDLLYVLRCPLTVCRYYRRGF